MKRIDIPTPCHENWADFTPTEKGAFCGSCQIDVVDFSNKSSEEVKQILKENAGKSMCGRFKKSQLEELNDDFFAWENQSSKSFQSKFLYACLIVFGMTLFTSCNLNDHHIMGEMIASTVENIDADHRLNISKSDNHSEIEPEDSTDVEQQYNSSKFRKGKVAYVPDEEEESQCINDTSEVENEFILGDTVYLDRANQTNDINEDTLFDDMMIDGEIDIPDNFNNYVEDTAITKVDKDSFKNTSRLDSTIEKESFFFQAHLFPNPTADNAKIVVNVRESGLFNIYLYAINGKQIKQIHHGRLSTGEFHFKTNLNNYPSGKYLVVIESNKQKETLKLEKIE